MKRKQAAKEFGIKTIHFVPFVDPVSKEAGVIEFGTSEEAALSDVTLEATLKMQCQTANAAYGIFWKQVGERAIAAGSYVDPQHAAEMKAAGKRLNFAEASKATTFPTSSAAPVAEVLRTRQTVLIDDAKGCELDGRYKACEEYGINQIVYVPVLGGVLEYGVSDTCREQWKGLADAHVDAVPKAELERAFRDGATYAIYWRKTGDKFDVAATYETKSQNTNAAAAA